MKKIKLVEIIPSLEPVGGGQTLFVNLCEQFLTFYKDKIDLTVIILYEKKDNFLYKRLDFLNCNTIFLNKKPGIDLKSYKLLRRELNLIKPDIIHSHLSSFVSLYLASLFHSRRAIIHTVHHIIGPEYLKDEFFVKLVNKKIMYPVCVCKTGSVSLKRYVKFDVPFINNGLNISKYDNKRKVSDRRITFLCVASFTDVKNHKYLIDCISDYIDKYGNCVVHCLGDGPLLKECVDYAAYKGISNQIVFHGNVSDPQKYMSDAKVLLVPSKSEANPMVINEAIVSGMYIVANNVGGIPDVVVNKQLGLLVEPNNKIDFVEKMRIVKDDDFLEKCRVSNSKTIFNYSIDKCADSYFKLFCEVMEKNDNK